MRALTLVFFALLTAHPAAAQVKFEMTPYFASYYATAKTKDDPPDTERQEAGPGVGLQAIYRFTHIVGVQATVTHVWSGIIPLYPVGPGTINTLLPTPGRIWFGTMRATIQPRRSNYFLAAGFGITRRAGKAWDDIPGIDELTTEMLSVGYGIRARVTPEFAFNIGVDANFYKADFDGDAGDYYRGKLQRDILVTIGVPIALIER